MKRGIREFQIIIDKQMDETLTDLQNTFKQEKVGDVFRLGIAVLRIIALAKTNGQQQLLLTIGDNDVTANLRVG